MCTSKCELFLCVFYCVGDINAFSSPLYNMAIHPSFYLATYANRRQFYKYYFAVAFWIVRRTTQCSVMAWVFGAPAHGPREETCHIYIYCQPMPNMIVLRASQYHCPWAQGAVARGPRWLNLALLILLAKSRQRNSLSSHLSLIETVFYTYLGSFL